MTTSYKGFTPTPGWVLVRMPSDLPAKGYSLKAEVVVGSGYSGWVEVHDWLVIRFDCEPGVENYEYLGVVREQDILGTYASE